MRELLRLPLVRVLGGAVGLAVVASVTVAGIYIFGGAAPANAPRAGTPAATLTPSANEQPFTITSSGSEATFTIDEVLFGQPNTVVGKTSQVSGQILVNPGDPAKSRLDALRVDLTTLVTDNDLRNRTLQNRILETGVPANQFATFSATAIQGMPATVAVGQTVQFRLVGNLTLHQVTRQETFTVTLTVRSATSLTGTAETTVRYADYKLAIPNVPSVSGVSPDVKLALTFTATRSA